MLAVAPSEVFSFVIEALIEGRCVCVYCVLCIERYMLKIRWLFIGATNFYMWQNDLVAFNMDAFIYGANRDLFKWVFIEVKTGRNGYGLVCYVILKRLFYSKNSHND